MCNGNKMRLLDSKLKLFLASLLAGGLFGLPLQASDAPPPKEEKKISQYHESISALNGQLERIRENKEKIDRLIEEKNHSTNQTRIAEIIAEVNTIEKENKKFTSEARKLQYDIKYLYPEKGEETDRIYKRYNIKELTEQDELSFAERIDGVLNYTRKVYGPTEAELEAAERARLKKLEEEAKKAENPKYRFEKIRVDK
jgi:hypothetical protein